MHEPEVKPAETPAESVPASPFEPIVDTPPIRHDPPRNYWLVKSLIIGLAAGLIFGAAGTLWYRQTHKKIVAVVKTTAPAPEPTPAPTTVTNTWVAATVDPKALPIGDGKTSLKTAAVGTVYTCQAANPAAGGASATGPWIHGATWDSTAKTKVQGAVKWPSANYTIAATATTRTITTNSLPLHEETGTFPIAKSDPAYAYDKNPNHIAAQSTTVNLPVTPTVAASPGCLPGGAIGILANGVYLFNALDGPGRDAVSHETQDVCDGHPERTSAYHYHDVPSCLRDVVKGSSTLVGWAYDGYPIYVERDASGSLPTNKDLDVCHGRTSPVLLDGKVVTAYHYSATLEYPYTIGCFHGTNAVPTPKP
jgi:hypothetical protein